MKNISEAVRTILAGALFSCWLCCPQAQAAPVTGDIGFSGGVSFDTNSLATATEVTAWSSPVVSSTSGSFATANGGVPLNTPVSMTPTWVFNPSTAYSPLWSLTYNAGADSYSFNLAASTIVTQNAGLLYITGIGTVMGTGFDNTPGNWSFSVTSAGGGSHANFSFQSDTAAVPEGSTAVLFAIGGTCLASSRFLRRRVKAA
jgi:hypothetical protein